MDFQSDIRDGRAIYRPLSCRPSSETLQGKVLTQNTNSDFCKIWNDAERARSAAVKALVLTALVYLFERIPNKRRASSIASTLTK